MKNLEIADAVRGFFCDHLQQQKNASPKTISAYRDTFRLLLKYLSRRRRRTLDTLRWTDLDSDLVLGFLGYLEEQRHNSPRTRNARLAAIRSFIRYALAFKEPEYWPDAQCILAIPSKRFNRPLLGFLSREEIQSLLNAPDPRQWSGRRDRVLFTLLYNTGARISEILQLRVEDVGEGNVHLLGKGRKDRIVPLWKSTARLIRQWIRQHHLQTGQPLLANRWGQPLTRAGAAHRLRCAVRKAALSCPSLNHHRLSPHTFRHTTAMHLLQSGVALEVIALWLGHESPVTTHHYIEADLALKQKALQRVAPPHTKSVRFRPDDELLRFLDSL
jgi:site-specific recombinase XerD